ncbi:hypothetical protein BJ741DRAFT_668483 [Chytriomyces cf. hyalinus JEL632]|nr:hypothetical protein BJ741DRAFT_668483 [Chytriomyces cf. hyalinus JEL632]
MEEAGKSTKFNANLTAAFVERRKFPARLCWVAAHDFEEVEDVHDMEEFDEGDEEEGDDDIDDPEEDEEEAVAMDSDSDDEPVVTRGRNAGECLASFQFQTASVSERFEQFRAILESDGIDFGSLSGNMFA